MREYLYFQTIINASPDIIVLKDAESRWLTVNKRTLEIFGISEDLCRGKSDAELGEIYPHFKKYVPQFLKSDHQAWEAKHPIQAKEMIDIDGAEHIFDVVKVPIFDKEGHPDAIVVIGRDLTPLLQSEQRYKSLFFNHPDAVYSLDNEGRFLDVNTAAEKISGYTRDELLQINFRSIICSERIPHLNEAFNHVLGGNLQRHETQIVRKDGQIRDLLFTTIPSVFNRQVIGIQGIAYDITEKKKLEKLRAEEAVVLSKIAAGDALADILHYIIQTVKNVSAGIGYVMLYEKESGLLRFGYGPQLDFKYVEKIDKMPVASQVASCGHAAFTKELTITTDIGTDPRWAKWRKDALLSGFHSCWSMPILSAEGALLGTFAIHYKDRRQPQEIEISMLKMFSYLSGLAIDRHIREEKYHYLALHDVLTELPNLRYLRDIFPKMVQESTELAVMFLDLDHFKSINDAFGHDLGDLLLQEIAGRIKKTIGECNVVARMGGDEFIMLVQDISSLLAAEDIADQVLNAISEPLILEGREFHTTGSIGISLYREHGTSIETLMKNADVAMFNVKDSGGNGKRIYKPSMNEKSYELYMLQSEFRKALEQNQFELHYQPQVDMNTGVITSVEALARWRHPAKGYISPATFIPLAEENGFILELGTWVLKKACEQVREWKNSYGLDISIAINVSVKQFIQQDVASLVKAALEEMGLQPSCLEIEITESVLITHEAIIQNSIAELQKLGVKISIDDFGTGYASLTYLKHFQANTIKIDRSFIQSLPHKKQDAAIVSAIIGLANDLHMDVISEGVESKEQLDFLYSKGCTKAQGYYFSRPLPAADILQLLREKTFSK